MGEFRCKVKAFLVIFMIVGAEARRIERLTREALYALNERPGANSSPEPRANGKDASIVDSATDGPLELEALFDGPDFVKRIQGMAGHMDKCVGTLRSKKSVQVRADEMTAELARLAGKPSSYADSKLPEQMEAMFADTEFEKQAQLFGEEMQKLMKEGESAGNLESQRELEELNAALSAQKESMNVAEKFGEVMNDSKFQQHQERVSNIFDSLAQDSDLQRQAHSIAAYVESLKDSTQNSKEAQSRPVSEQIEAMMTNRKLGGLASEVVLEMLRNELKSTPMEWIAYLDEEQITSISEDRDVWELIIKDGQKSKEVPERSLLEVVQANAQAFAFAPLPLGLKVPTMHHPQLRPALVPHRRPDSRLAAGRNFGPRIQPPRMAMPGPGHSASNAAVTPGPGALHAVSKDGEAWLSEADAAAGHSTSRQEGPPEAQGEEGSALTSAKGIRSMLPSLVKALPQKAKGLMSADGKRAFSLLLCLSIWYLGKFLYNVTNKRALTATGGATGFPFTVATLQLGVGAVYALFAWVSRIEGKHSISFKDYTATFPISFMAAGTAAASVFALSAGSVSFAQIVGASEPAFAAVIATLLYGAKVSKAKWLTLIPVIGGVVLASLGEVNFAFAALVSACLANVFAALKLNENNKLINTPGLSERLGSVGNQFALTTINSFVLMLPIMLLTEGHKFGEFVTLVTANPALQYNLFWSGVWNYIYIGFGTRFIKKTSPVTQSVANTAGRVVLIGLMAAVLKESLTPLKLIGSGITIAGVYVYTIIDKVVAARKEKIRQKRIENNLAAGLSPQQLG